MTVALLAERHRRGRYLWVGSVALFSIVIGGGVATARAVQHDLADDVATVLGVTNESIEIRVDGRDVTLRSSGPISQEQRQAVAGVPNIAGLTVEGEG